MNIPVAKPFVGSSELAGIEGVFKTGWLGMGSSVFEFENAIKKYIGVKNVIAVNTGTSALHIALDSFGIGRGDEVIVPSMTFVATPHAVLMCGAKVVFCDIEKDTLNMDPKDLKKRITKRTKAVIPVHYSGLSCDMNGIMAIAKADGLHIVEDAAHAFGSTYGGKMIGSFGGATCFSFDPIKVITCGEGGAIATNDDLLAKKIIRRRILGIDNDTYSRYKHTRQWFYRVTDPGYRYHMSNINAAIGLAQLKNIDAFLERRRAIARAYDAAFGSIEEIRLIKKDYNCAAPFNYIIKVGKAIREPLIEFLKTKGVGAGVHYIPNHLQPFYRKAKKVRLPVTEKVAPQILTLPLYYGMTDADIEKVILSIREYFKR